MSTTIFVTVEAKPKFTSEVETALRKMIPATLAEAGSVSYELFRSEEKACTFHLLEAYANDEALASHQKSTHFAELLTSLVDKLAQDIQIERIVKIEVK